MRLCWGVPGFVSWFVSELRFISSKTWLSSFIKILFSRRHGKFWETTSDYQHFSIPCRVCLTGQRWNTVLHLTWKHSVSCLLRHGTVPNDCRFPELDLNVTMTIATPMTFPVLCRANGHWPYPVKACKKQCGQHGLCENWTHLSRTFLHIIIYGVVDM